MADWRNFLLQPRLLKIARNSKSILPKSHYIYLCTYSVVPQCQKCHRLMTSNQILFTVIDRNQDCTSPYNICFFFCFCKIRLHNIKPRYSFHGHIIAISSIFWQCCLYFLMWFQFDNLSGVFLFFKAKFM